MSDPAPRGTASDRCYLLELPGELRSHIYDCVLAHYDESTDPVPDARRYLRLFRPGFTPWYNRSCPGHEECQWSELKRKSLGLTQTCRTIRREFRPLHFTGFVMHLDSGLDEVPRYISRTFSRVQDASGLCFLRTDDHVGNCIEMLPLIQLLSKAPNFTLKYETSHRDQVNFAALIDVKGNKKWKEYVEKNVTRISYFTDYRNILKPPKNQLFVNVRHTVGEPWMIEEKKKDAENEAGWMRNRTPANKPECVRKWLEFAGIPHLDETLDDVGIQVAAADEDSESDASSDEDS